MHDAIRARVHDHLFDGMRIAHVAGDKTIRLLASGRGHLGSVRAQGRYEMRSDEAPGPRYQEAQLMALAVKPPVRDGERGR